MTLDLFVSFVFRRPYFACRADIPDPLREPNDVFLQLLSIPVPKGSAIGGGCCGGGGRKSIQFVGAVRWMEKYCNRNRNHFLWGGLSHLERSA